MATAQNHAAGNQAPDVGGGTKNRPRPNTTATEQVAANASFTAAGIATTGGGER